MMEAVVQQIGQPSLEARLGDRPKSSLEVLLTALGVSATTAMMVTTHLDADGTMKSSSRKTASPRREYRSADVESCAFTDSYSVGML